MTSSDGGSPFWRFSLQFYRRPGVADACLALQDEAGVDVNLLLFLLWQATIPRQMPAPEVARLEARIAPWREAAVIPLRNLRRALKAPPGLVAPQAAEAFRARIKAAELEAERLQQEAMFALSGTGILGTPAPSPPAAARANIAAYQAIRPVVFPAAAAAALMDAFAAEFPAASQGRA